MQLNSVLGSGLTNEEIVVRRRAVNRVSQPVPCPLGYWTRNHVHRQRLQYLDKVVNDKSKNIACCYRIHVHYIIARQVFKVCITIYSLHLVKPGGWLIE